MKKIFMYCRYCGKELQSNSNFCQNCGENTIIDIETLSRENNQQTSENFMEFEIKNDEKKIATYVNDELRCLKLEQDCLDLNDTASGLTFKDYYLILRIGNEATFENIEDAFIRVCDKYKSEGFDPKDLKDVQEAFAILSHKETRILYDKELSEFNKFGDFGHYVIKDPQLANIIKKIQKNVDNKTTTFSDYVSKLGKGCLKIVILILIIMLSTCFSAIMKQEGRNAVKNSYSSIESNY